MVRLRVQVPNEKLMAEELLNITQSRPFQERLFFEVDARLVSQATLDDLTDRVAAMVASEDDCSLFDQSFESFAHIAAVTNPLKYQVCPLASLDSIVQTV